MLRLLLTAAGIVSLAIAGYLVTERVMERRLIRKRLALVRAAVGRTRVLDNTFLGSLSRRFEDLILFTGSRLNPEAYITLSLLGALFGSVGGANIFNSKMTGLVLAVWLAASPLVWLQTMADRKEGQIDSVLIDFLHQFMNRYSEVRDIRLALAGARENQYPVIAREVGRLKNRLNAGDSLEEALYDFASRLRNRWLRYFADMVVMAGKTGAPISGPVSTLIAQLQRTEKRQSRIWSTMLLYRTAFLAVSFSAFASYYWMSRNIPRTFYYFTNTDLGKNLILISSILMVICFLILMLQRR